MTSNGGDLWQPEPPRGDDARAPHPQDQHEEYYDEHGEQEGGGRRRRDDGSGRGSAPQGQDPYGRGPAPDPRDPRYSPQQNQDPRYRGPEGPGRPGPDPRGGQGQAGQAGQAGQGQGAQGQGAQAPGQDGSWFGAPNDGRQPDPRARRQPGPAGQPDPYDPRGRQAAADPRAGARPPHPDQRPADPRGGRPQPEQGRQGQPGQGGYRGQSQPQPGDPRAAGRQAYQGPYGGQQPDPRAQQAPQQPYQQYPQQAQQQAQQQQYAQQQQQPGGHRAAPPPPPGRGGGRGDNRALFRDEIPQPQPVGAPAGPGGSGGPAVPEAAAHAAVEAEPAARDWRDDYEEAVSATRWDLTPIPSMPVAPRRANPSNLEALIPPRRGRVQGPATRHPGGPAGTGPGVGTREPDFAPWEGRSRTETAPPETKPETKSNVGRASRLMALGTMASRATGLIRQFMIVATLTTGTLGDAYNAGNNLPNIIYILVLGGALNAVFVPQLVRAMNRDRDGGAAFASRLVTLTVVSLLVLTVVAVFAAPQLVDLFTSFKHPEDRSVAIIFAELCLPQIFFYGVFVILGQILNAQGRFGPMMWTPVLANVVSIAVFGAYWWIVKDPLTTSTIRSWQPILRLVGIGTTLGIAVQTLTLIPYVRASGLRLKPRFDWRGTGLGKSFTLAKWTVAFVLVNQVGLLVVMRYATAVGSDYQNWGLTAYNSAYMIWGLPQAIITVSVITALLPRMSRSAAEKDLASVREDISYGLRATGVAIVPAAFAFLALGQQIAMVLFMYGSVQAPSAHIIGYMLMAFGLGLIPFSAQFLMLRGFYAFEDTRTPFTINIWISAANVAMSSAVYYGMKHTNYAQWSVVIMCAVYGVSYCIGLAITAAKLKRRLRGLESGRIMQTYTRLMAAAAVAAGAAYVVTAYLTHIFGAGSRIGAYVGLIVGGGILGLVFLLCARLMKVEEVEQLVGSLRRKLGR